MNDRMELHVQLIECKVALYHLAHGENMFGDDTPLDVQMSHYKHVLAHTEREIKNLMK